MIKKILDIGNPLLREVSKEVNEQDIKSSDIQTLIQDLIDTLRDQKSGVAISAVQIGVPVRLFIVEIKPTPNRPEFTAWGPIAFINPVVTSMSEEKIELPEACLSIFNAELFGNVVRSKSLQIKYLDQDGTPQEAKYEDFIAKVIQHEMDHLNGVLFTDLADPHSFATAAEYRKARSRQKEAKKQ
ncbi:MAG: peptide deformylase [Candidatus Doudnabacteria bacterium]|nr:peptide deformylase [Candidatus Doudnabacteria bacterium]